MDSQAPTSPLLTVTQLTHAIKLSLESTFPFVHLQGEISNFKLQTSGHLYFSLKDANAQITAVMFKGDASSLKVMPKAGDHVVVKGELNVYPPKGNYQLIIRELAYMGLGELLQKLEQLKIKLHQKGWFKTIHKKPLPHLPRRIGVVTSPTGAVIQDILHVLTRRFSGFHLILNPVKVQGEGAAQEIAQAIEQFNRYQLVDVMIVGRGGGSLEDLWAFNEERVAEAIFNSQIPIISAVGHETDHCIADYVADVRAPTPSAAAEIVIAEKAQQLEHLRTVRRRLQQTVQHLVHQNRYRLEALSRHPFFTQPRLLLEWRMQKLDDCRQDIDQTMQQQLQLKRHRLESFTRQAVALKPTNQLMHLRNRLRDWEKALTQRMQNQIWQDQKHLHQSFYKLQQIWMNKHLHRRHVFDGKQFSLRIGQLAKDHHLKNQQKLLSLTRLLAAIDPKTLLQKGYSILFAEKDPFVINSIRKLRKGQQAKLLLSDGEALITINEVIPSE
ncbi:exodeoxyribonuclease VII large subunit [Candidatus Protochlamydia phocaeensis]|uniref:exodeoxyribonuclease VII large subunit n=1 Tax=Candidatus Protochlamydia phocaeensis TaxID=1414722 RepID=UPI000838E6ED|nr:exodeoxyribonuclease VII large subunit [Candidatus Protochlamydia phocaeensis]